jgi:hypothetical protein
MNNVMNGASLICPSFAQMQGVVGHRVEQVPVDGVAQ